MEVCIEVMHQLPAQCFAVFHQPFLVAYDGRAVPLLYWAALIDDTEVLFKYLFFILAKSDITSPQLKHSVIR